MNPLAHTTARASLSFLLLLGLVPGAIGAICDDKYAEAYPSGEVPLNCMPFSGATTLHGVLWGCNTLNQDEEPPANVKSQTFTEICEATVTPETLYTCYQMAANTDYTTFTSSIDPNLACVDGDKFTSPKCQYLQTTAQYTDGGNRGRQSTDIPSLKKEWDATQVENAYYEVTITAPEGQVMTSNPAFTSSPAPEVPDRSPSEDFHESSTYVSDAHEEYGEFLSSATTAVSFVVSAGTAAVALLFIVF